MTVLESSIARSLCKARSIISSDFSRLEAQPAEDRPTGASAPRPLPDTRPLRKKQRESEEEPVWLACLIYFCCLGSSQLFAQPTTPSLSNSPIGSEWSASSLQLDASVTGVGQAQAGTDNAMTTGPTQASPQGGQSPTKDQELQQSGVSTATPQPAESAKHDNKRHTHRGAIVPAPLPIASPAVGLGVIPGLGYIFPFNEKDKLSPPSTVGAAGLITNNGSRGFGLGADLYMGEDKYEVTSIYVHGNVNYNLYGSGPTEGLKLPLNQEGQLFRIEVLRRLVGKIFIGPRFWTGDSFVTLVPTDKKIPPLPADVGLHTTLRAFGARVLRDTRSSQFYPTSGKKIDFTADIFSQNLGSKYSFQAYRFTFNTYKSLRKNQVLAYNLFLCGTGGSPPFYGNCIYGSSNELRGYAAGKYLDRYMGATQLEYRLTLPRGFGLAGFGGVGEVIPGANQTFRGNHFLPDVGAGPRFELSKQYHVNLRTDFARGRDSWTWSMGVGEAF
jgi:hypothetical protein